MLYALTLVFIIGYGFLIYFWGARVAWRLDHRPTRMLKAIHYFGITVCFFVAGLFLFLDIGLRGLWTTRIFIVITLITGTFFKFVADGSSLGKIENLYFRLFSFLPMLIAGLLLIPFLGILFVASLFGILGAPAEKVYYEDENLRVQSTFVGVLGPPRIDIYEKEFIFERHLLRADYWASEVDSISVSYDSDSTRVIAYGLYDYDSGTNTQTEIISFEHFR